MAAIVSRVEVAGRPDDVFSYVTDPTRFTEWQENVVDGCMEGSEPVLVPTRTGSEPSMHPSTTFSCHSVKRVGSVTYEKTSSGRPATSTRDTIAAMGFSFPRTYAHQVDERRPRGSTGAGASVGRGVRWHLLRSRRVRRIHDACSARRRLRSAFGWQRSDGG